MQTILNFDCFPAGMEMFPAMDEGIFEYIKRIIDDSDYYLLIIGGRYGDVDESGVSWNEKEYDYAVSKHIPIIVFDHKDFTKLPADKTDQDDKKRKKLIAFKKKVSKGRLIKYWTDAKDLVADVAKSLPKVLEQQQRIGWVRADSITSADEQKEIKRLKNEIAYYRELVITLEEDLEKRDENSYSRLEDSKKKAQQEIKSLQEKIDQLQQECDDLKAQKDKSQEKVNNVTRGLEIILDELKGNKELMESQPKVKTVTIPGTDVSFRMVHVDGGTFMMGANKYDDDAFDNEIPVHQVTLSDYYIGETLVTQALWQTVMGRNPSRFKGDPNRPVEYVSWEDCQVFIEKLNRLTGKSFHLPTEAQWEFAARGGVKSKGYKYAGGDDIKKVAWYGENSEEKTNPVAQKDANELGLYDMSGNVFEWCDDWYGLYHGVAQTEPRGLSDGSFRVVRAGAWTSYAGICRLSYRGQRHANVHCHNLGLRLAL